MQRLFDEEELAFIRNYRVVLCKNLQDGDRLLEKIAVTFVFVLHLIIADFRRRWAAKNKNI